MSAASPPRSIRPRRAVRAALPFRRLGERQGREAQPCRSCSTSRSAAAAIDVPPTSATTGLEAQVKRFGSLDGLKQALELVRACGMEPVLGDGVRERSAMLDGGLRRPPCHPQRRRQFQRLSEAEGAVVRRAAAVRGRCADACAGYVASMNADVLAGAAQIDRERFVAARASHTEASFTMARSAGRGATRPPIATDDLGRSYVTPSLNTVSGHFSP